MKKQYNFKRAKRGAVIKIPKDPRIEEVYEREVSFTCPVRGKVTQKVKIHRFKPAATNDSGKHILQTTDSIDRLEEQDDGLAIYSDGEDLGLAGDVGNE